MEKNSRVLFATAVCLITLIFVTESFAVTTYSSITGILHVEGANVPGDGVYDAHLGMSGTNFSEILVSDEFVLQDAVNETTPILVPSTFYADSGMLHLPVVAVTDGQIVTQYLELEMMHITGSQPMRFQVTSVSPADLGKIGLNAGTNAGDLMTWDGNNWTSRKPADQNWNNMQPFTTLNFIIALQGIYPSRSGADPFIGEIEMVGFNFAPTGWATCDGQLLSISSNTALFSLLGITYGGNGSTTFALPDLRGRVPVHQGQGSGLTNRIMGEKGGTETLQ